MDACCSTMSKKDKAEMEAREREWRAEADIRTLIDAEKIKLDPDRFKAALTKRKAMLTELENIKA